MTGAQANDISARTRPSEALTREFSIVNQRGLHARASAKFVQMVESHDADVEVEKDGITVGGTSIMGLMMLAASPGCKIRVSASGPEAEALLDALQTLIAERFGEEC
ncbi:MULTISPECIES: HPr family phosphocarrier protein [unclassified Nitratireductor]|uniref:HPr family phosphocarrier protein n=1 Tax=unclassified Nitratireductor TaxID=2641084 RepID=UPI0025D363A6|nr:HPr family phosphocarrier protein [Nitratireductor sp.]